MPEPLLPVVPQQVPLVQRRLIEPIRHRQLLDTVVTDLAQDMARELEGQGAEARRLELGLWRVDGEVVVRRQKGRPEVSGAYDPAVRGAARRCGCRVRDRDAAPAGQAGRNRWQLGDGRYRDRGGNPRHVAGGLYRPADRPSRGAGDHPPAVPFATIFPNARSAMQQEPLEPGFLAGQLAFHARPLKLLDSAESIAVLYATPDGYPQRFRWRGQVHEVARVGDARTHCARMVARTRRRRGRDYYRIEDGPAGATGSTAWASSAMAGAALPTGTCTDSVPETASMHHSTLAGGCVEHI